MDPFGTKRTEPIKSTPFPFLFLLLWLVLICAGPEAAEAYNLPSPSIHGFLSPGYLRSTDNDYLGLSTRKGTFSLSEAAINVSVDPVPKLRVGMQLFAYDFGAEGNFDVVLDWAVGDYRWKDWLGVRAGKVKMPVGLYNKERDLDMLRTSILLPQSIYASTMRSFTNTFLGGEAYGVVPGALRGDFEYELFLGTIDADNTPVIRGFIVQGATGALPAGTEVTLLDLAVEVEYILGGSLKWNTPVEGLRLAGSFYKSQSEMDAALLLDLPLVPGSSVVQYTTQFPLRLDYRVNYAYVFSAEYTRGNLILAAEYFYQRSDIRFPPTADIPPLPDLEQNMEGVYGQLRYRFFDRVEVGTYYSIYFPNADDKDGDLFAATGKPDFLAWERDLAVSLRIDILANWLVKFEAHFIDGAALVDVPEDLESLKRRWGLFGFKTTFHF